MSQIYTIGYAGRTVPTARPPLAQRTERPVSNREVGGSNPSGRSNSLTPYFLGHTYTVPCVRGDWQHSCGKRWWPVNGPVHDDDEWLGFKPKHWHVDPRFITPAAWSQVGGDFYGHINHAYDVYGIPIRLMDICPLGFDSVSRRLGLRCDFQLDYDTRARAYLQTLPKRSWFRWLRRDCFREYPNPIAKNRDGDMVDLLGVLAEKLRPGFEDSRLNLTTRVCPHKGANLTGVEPDDGVIQCPLHGLRFCAETGKSIWTEKEATK